ncbi:MAG: alpha/beta hydrolase-fold protein [Actinomycetota bacterium]|nr:alpha/beta hydrolase-fold protein [Actinomycetota bacterium]
MDATSVTFEVADPDRRLCSVRLWQEVGLPVDRLTFARTGPNWVLRIDRPPVQRMEYLLRLAHVGGAVETVPDPANPAWVPSAFGPHSVVEFPGYAPPAWLGAPAVDGSWNSLRVAGRALGADVEVRIWCPAGMPAGAPLPLLVVHDGPEYDALASLSRYCAAAIAGGVLPAHRLALLAPGHRDEWYSCSTPYADALTAAVLPALRIAAPAPAAPVGMGTSLGALAMLHAQRRQPGSFSALFLQSGSFFTPRFDAHEVRFGRYPRIVRFVADTLRAPTAREKVPVAMTCGAIEENVANNRLMAAALAAQGYPVHLDEVADVHNYIGWRDAFDPFLTDLLHRAWIRA